MENKQSVLGKAHSLNLAGLVSTPAQVVHYGAPTPDRTDEIDVGRSDTTTPDSCRSRSVGGRWMKKLARHAAAESSGWLVLACVSESLRAPRPHSIQYDRKQTRDARARWSSVRCRISCRPRS